MNAHVTEDPNTTMRKTLTAFFAWATLAAGSIVLVAGACFIAYHGLRFFIPDITEKTLLMVFFGISLVGSPAFVIMVLNWFKGGGSQKRTNVQTRD